MPLGTVPNLAACHLAIRVRHDLVAGGMEARRRPAGNWLNDGNTVGYLRANLIRPEPTLQSLPSIETPQKHRSCPRMRAANAVPAEGLPRSGPTAARILMEKWLLSISSLAVAGQCIRL